MPIPTFKFNNLTRTDLLQFDGVNFVNVPVYAVGKNVMWGPEGVGYNSLIVGDVTKNISLVNHKHTTDDILGLRELINDLGVNSNSGTSIDLSKYLLTSTFIDHLNNIGSAKHVTQAHLDKLNNYWQLDEQGNLYTTYNTYSTGELSAYGVGASESGVGASSLYELSDVDPSVENAPENSILKKIGTHWKAVSGDLQPLLVSGTNIATINGQNLLNGGNILIEAGSSGSSGSVSSVGLSAPVGLTVTGSPITGSGTLALSFTPGYSIPTTAKQNEWDSAYTNSHSHSNKTQIDLITQAHINVLNKLFIDADDNVYTTENFYSTKEVSAYGKGEGGGGGGGGAVVSWGTELNGGVGLTVDGITKTLALKSGLDLKQDKLIAGSGITIVGNTISSTATGGGGGTVVSWGTLTNGYRQLTVEGVTYALAQNTHKHLWADITDKPSTFIPSTHTHSAGDITSGTFAIARIPTGTTGTTVALGNHLHTGVYEPVFTKNTAFNKNFGTTSGTVAQGNDSRIINGQTAFDWGNHASAGYALNSVLSGYVTTSRIITAGNGLTGGGTLAVDRTLTLATPSTLTAETTNGVTASSHTHAITTTSVGDANTIIQTDATGGTKLNNLIVGGDWKLEQVGTELQLKYNDVVAQRFLLDGSIVGLGEITAYGATTGGEGVSLLRTGGTMTGPIRWATQNSKTPFIGHSTSDGTFTIAIDGTTWRSGLSLEGWSGNLFWKGYLVLDKANTADKIEMGNGWTIEQTTASLTIRKNGVIKGTFNA